MLFGCTFDGSVFLLRIIGVHSIQLIVRLCNPTSYIPPIVSPLSQSLRTAATQKRNSELDELEKELGLDLLDTVGNDNKTTGSDGSTAEGAAGKYLSGCVCCTLSYANIGFGIGE